MNNELAAHLASRGGFCIPEHPYPQNWITFYARLSGQASHHKRIAEKYLYDLKPRPVNFGFVGTGALNAMAYATRLDEDSSFDFIGINAGAPITLIATFFNILARKELFPEVGDTSLELKEVPFIDYLNSNAILHGMNIAEPQCAVRRTFAEELLNIAFDFLYFHELSHLKNGHLELWRQYTNVGSIVEASGSAGLASSKLRRTLEANADCGGLEGAMLEAHGKHANLAHYKTYALPENYSGACAAYGSATAATLSSIFAIYVVFRLFDEDFSATEEPPTDAYPPPAIRFCTILKAILPHHGWLGRNEVGQFEMQMIQTAINAEIACAAICGGNVDATRLIGAAVNIFPKFESEFEETWAEISPALNQFKRGSTLDFWRL